MPQGPERERAKQNAVIKAYGWSRFWGAKDDEAQNAAAEVRNNLGRPKIYLLRRKPKKPQGPDKS